MWYDMGLAVDPNNPDAFFLDAIDIWKSTDGGQTLTDISCGYYARAEPDRRAGPRRQPRARLPAGLVDEPAGRQRRRHLRLEQRGECAAGDARRRQQPPDVQGRQPDDEHDRVLRRRHQLELRHVEQPVHRRRRAGQRLVLRPVRPGRDVSRHRLPVVAADRRRRLLRAHRAEAGPARVHGEPERRAAAVDDRPGRPVPVRRRARGAATRCRSSSRTRSTSSRARRRPAIT